MKELHRKRDPSNTFNPVVHAGRAAELDAALNQVGALFCLDFSKIPSPALVSIVHKHSQVFHVGACIDQCNAGFDVRSTLELGVHVSGCACDLGRRSVPLGVVVVTAMLREERTNSSLKVQYALGE